MPTFAPLCRILASERALSMGTAPVGALDLGQDRTGVTQFQSRARRGKDRGRAPGAMRAGGLVAIRGSWLWPGMPGLLR